MTFALKQLLMFTNYVQQDMRHSMKIPTTQCVMCRAEVEHSDDSFQEMMFKMTGMCEDCFNGTTMTKKLDEMCEDKPIKETI